MVWWPPVFKPAFYITTQESLKKFDRQVFIISYLLKWPWGLQLYLKRVCFPVNFAKILRTRFLQNTSGRLLLYDRYFLLRHIKGCILKSQNQSSESIIKVAIKVFKHIRRKQLCWNIFSNKVSTIFMKTPLSDKQFFFNN